MEYILEIYPPRDRKTADAMVTSETPFMAFSKGNLIHLPYSGRDVLIEDLLHIISVPRDGGAADADKLCIYTCELPPIE